MKLPGRWRHARKRARSLKLIGFVGVMEIANQVVPPMSDPAGRGSTAILNPDSPPSTFRKYPPARSASGRLARQALRRSPSCLTSACER